VEKFESSSCTHSVYSTGFGWTNGVMLAWLEDVALGKVQCDIT
jgi:neutral trehalase